MSQRSLLCSADLLAEAEARADTCWDNNDNNNNIN